MFSALARLGRVLMRPFCRHPVSNSYLIQAGFGVPILELECMRCGAKRRAPRGGSVC